MIDATIFTPWTFFTDMGLICMLLLVGKIIRVKVKIVQKLFIPPSLIAGLLGLAFGPNGFGVLPFSNNLGTYASVLIALVFGALPLSSPNVKAKDVARRVGPMWAYAQLGMLLQWGIAGLFGLLFLNLIWPDLNQAFGVMLPTGFYGGHGTAAAVGTAFNSLGWSEAESLGMTTATIGVVCAILCGLAFIKIGAARKQTSFIVDFKDLPDELRSGLLPEDKRTSMGTATTSSISIDSLTFHIAFVFVIALGGYLISMAVKQWYPKLELPVFSCAFIVGLLLKQLFNKVKVSDYICTQTTSRLSSAFTDLLVAFGVASIKLGVVVKYALPLIVLIIFGIVSVFLITFILGRTFSKTFWFERTIFAWGWWTGTMAMGIALLRIVDPDGKSKAMDDYALAYLPIAPVEILLITFVPIMFFNGMGLWLMLICLGLSGIILLVSWRMGWMAKRITMFVLFCFLSGGLFADNNRSFVENAYKKAEQGMPLDEAEIMVVADSVHRRYPTFDTHNDTAMYWNHPGADYSVQKDQVSFAKMTAGGLDGAFFAIYIEPGPIDEHSLDSIYNFCNDEIALFKNYVAKYSDVAEIAYSVDDVERVIKDGKHVVVQAIENGYPIGWKIENVEHFYDMGVRLITLSHNGHNTICDAAMDKSPELYGGLSQFGADVVKEMNRLGMIIDVSHTSSETLSDVLKVSKAPIVASHSGVWAIKNHKRNLKDDEIKAIADNGGTIQIATGRYFLSTLPKDQVTVRHLCDHIMYVYNLVGEDYIGIGSDFDGGGGVVGFEDVSKMKEITYELLRRGLTPTQLGKFWGGNILRVWSEVEKVSESLSQNEQN